MIFYSEEQHVAITDAARRALSKLMVDIARQYTETEKVSLLYGDAANLVIDNRNNRKTGRLYLADSIYTVPHGFNVDDDVFLRFLEDQEISISVIPPSAKPLGDNQNTHVSKIKKDTKTGNLYLTIPAWKLSKFGHVNKMQYNNKHAGLAGYNSVTIYPFSLNGEVL